MDEKRKFFRIKNKGEMRARFKHKDLHIIDISACSASILTDEELPESGIIEFQVNLFKIDLNYDVLRKDKEKTVLLFNEEEHIAKLLPVLKNLRKESI